METFPSYDFPLWGNTPLSTDTGKLTDLEISDWLNTPELSNIPVLSGGDAGDKFKTYNTTEPGGFTIGTVFSDLGGAIAKPIKAVETAITSRIRNTYFYLIGGIALLGIIAIFAMSYATKMQKG